MAFKKPIKKNDPASVDAFITGATADGIEAQKRNSEALNIPPAAEAAPEARPSAKSPRQAKAKKGAGGRPKGEEETRNVGVNIPVRLIAALDKFAGAQFGKNRSMALAAILDGKASLK